MASPFGGDLTFGSPFQSVTVDDGGGGTQGPQGQDLDTAGVNAANESDSLPGDVVEGQTPSESFPAIDPLASPVIPTEAADAARTPAQETGVISNLAGLTENLVILILVIVALQFFDVINL